jgi:hypothetical protein
MRAGRSYVLSRTKLENTTCKNKFTKERMHSMSRNAKRFRSLVITITMVAATNIAISYASNSKTGAAIIPDVPRPKTGAAIIPDVPRPKTGAAIIPDVPRPKTGAAIIPDVPRP